MMYHGCDGIFVGSGIFGAEGPRGDGHGDRRRAVNNWDDPTSSPTSPHRHRQGMKGQSNEDLPDEEKLQGRGV